MRRVRSVRTLALAAVFLGWGCASRQPAPGPPPPRAEQKMGLEKPKDGEADARPSDDAESLEAELARSEATLGAALAKDAQAGVAGGNHPAPQKAPPVEDACATACRALASMRRASERLCALTGPSDERCSKARQRTQTATARVKEACPSCAG